MSSAVGNASVSQTRDASTFWRHSDSEVLNNLICSKIHENSLILITRHEALATVLGDRGQRPNSAKKGPGDRGLAQLFEMVQY